MKRKISLASLPLVILIVTSTIQVAHQIIIPSTTHVMKADATIGESTESELTTQSGIETYTLSLPSAGYLNVLIPPDATVLSAELLGAQSGITWKYHGTFGLRCYQFAQIGVEISEGVQVTYLNVRIQVNRNTKTYIAAGADPLSDQIIERLSRNPTSGYTLPGLSFSNIEHSKEWRGYSIMPVMKVQNYQLPLSRINYVIITSEQLQTLLAPFMILKHRQGVEPFLMTTQTISTVYAGDRAQSRTLEFLKDAYNTWHMEYVLIVGGKSTLAPIEYQRMYNPDWPRGTGFMEGRTTDYYYSTLEQPSNSYTQTKYLIPDTKYLEPATHYPVDFPDFMLGRFPSDDASDIKNMIDKTTAYEQEENPGEWTRNKLLVSGEGLSQSQDWLQFTKGPRVHLSYPQNLTLNSLVDSINKGTGSVTLMAHADPHGWVLGGGQRFDYNNVNLLSNTKLPVIFTEGCHSGKGDASQSVAARLLALPNKGAVAIVSGMSYTPYGLEVYLSAYNYYPQYRQDSLPNADYQIGKAFYYFTSLDGVCEYMNILGDPSLILATSRYDLPIPEFSDMTAAAAFTLILTLIIIRRKPTRSSGRSEAHAAR
jgi:hypothetical protein